MIKEKKGLIYLIITIAIIATMVMACKNRTTEASYSESETVTIDSGSISSQKDFKQLIGKTIRSKEAIAGEVFYFWAEFDENGIKYGQGTSDMPPSSYRNASLNLDAFTDNRVNFSDNNGAIKFAFAGKMITNIEVVFTSGTDISYAGKTFECQFE